MKIGIKVLTFGMAMALALVDLGTASAKTLHFSGYDWTVRPSGTGQGPGPNNWDENNAWVDTSGRLHLALTQSNGKWYCGEVYTPFRLGFGIYQFQVTGQLDQLDPNVVLGLFNYPTPDVGPDGTNEIDIEFSRWGNPKANMLNYTVWPVKAALGKTSQTFPLSLGTATTSIHRFQWASSKVVFQSLAGSTDTPTTQLATWTFQPKRAQFAISQKTMPVHMNLWAFNGQPPSNGLPVEVIIDSFTFTPQ